MKLVCLTVAVLLVKSNFSVGFGNEISSVWTKEEKGRMREKTLEMFYHAYNSYMEHAYPGDELMPLSCKGRFRGSEADRGDIDEALGNFSLTLIDSLDTLAVIGNIPEFERATKLVIQQVTFETDVVVSVFETNIRVLGGLLGAHSVAVILREAGKGMLWYRNELLRKAIDIGDRLLLAFNTSTGIPFPKVNLKYGIYDAMSRVGHEQDTCTACAGTMIMEFAALSRLSGNPVYEEKAHKAMDSIWQYRSHYSNLVGTVINIHNGDWVRRDSGIGAGIDSYYEYCLKAYVLLGDESYLEKFNKHYHAINKYIRQGSMMLDVLMHQPEKPVRTFMDALQAFWPGLQVLAGDLKPAIEIHEMLYEVAKRHKFIPEAFTSNLDVYWAQHPLRPELSESTYFLYEATKDPYYLDVGKHILESMQNYTRVPCGFAAVKDVRTLSHEDKMDSFVLAETFKYLYLLFAEESDLVLNIHDFLFTTEAHLLPLTLSNLNSSGHIVTQQRTKNYTGLHNVDEEFMSSCPNKLSYEDVVKHTEEIRKSVRRANQGTCPTTEQKIVESYISSSPGREPKLRAEHFQVGNKEHLQMAKDMGITITLTKDGRVQLMHQAAQATTPEDAQDGIRFMQEMIQLAKTRGEQQGEVKPRVVQVVSAPYNEVVFSAGAAQFGIDLQANDVGVSSEVVEASPLKACTGIDNEETVENRIVLIERGECMFIDKVRHAQQLGALGVIIVDHNEGTSSETQPTFAMSGDSHSADVNIPSVFLFRKEGQILRSYIQEMESKGKYLVVRIGARAAAKDKPAIYIQDNQSNSTHDLDNTEQDDSISEQLPHSSDPNSGSVHDAIQTDTSMPVETDASSMEQKTDQSSKNDFDLYEVPKKQEKEILRDTLGRKNGDSQMTKCSTSPQGEGQSFCFSDEKQPPDVNEMESMRKMEAEIQAIHEEVKRNMELISQQSDEPHGANLKGMEPIETDKEEIELINANVKDSMDDSTLNDGRTVDSDNVLLEGSEPSQMSIGTVESVSQEKEKHDSKVERRIGEDTEGSSTPEELSAPFCTTSACYSSAAEVDSRKHLYVAKESEQGRDEMRRDDEQSTTYDDHINKPRSGE